MKKTSETVVFFGSGPVAAASLAHLVNHFSIEAVVTKSVPAHHKELAPVETLAKQVKLPIVFANTRAELDELIDTEPFASPIGIIVDYGVIVSKKVIDSFPLGIVNSHFSLLPEWRGADPITFAILSGQPKTGVSLMLIEPSLDTGKLLVQRSVTIKPSETTSGLTTSLVELSNNLLSEYVPKYIRGALKARAQPHPTRATYSRKLTKADGLIDWTKSAEQIEREIRAFCDWPRSRTTIGNKEVIITKAHVVREPVAAKKTGTFVIDEHTKQLRVSTGSGWLVVDRLQPTGKKEMATSAFLAGNRL